MKRRALLLAALAIGCGDAPDESPATIQWTRILAVVAEPPEADVNDPVTVSALVADPSGTVAATPSWYACRPVVPQEVTDCADRALWSPLGSGDAFTFDLPAPGVTGDSVFVPVIADVGEYWAVKRVYVTPLTPANANPVIDALLIAKEEGDAPVTVGKSTQIPLEIFASDDDETLTVEYFVTRGAIDDNLAPDLETRVFWTTPAEQADVTVYAVVRDGRGGLAWLSREALIR